MTKSFPTTNVGRSKHILLEENIYSKSVSEPVFQKILEGAPWLINPSWEPLTTNQSLTNFRISFAKWYKKKYNGDISMTTEIKKMNNLLQKVPNNKWVRKMKIDFDLTFKMINDISYKINIFNIIDPPYYNISLKTKKKKLKIL